MSEPVIESAFMQKPSNIKVYDCFKYYNEAHILNLRLNILKDVVDYFVLVESTYTHAGKPKPLYFDPAQFPQFRERIIHVVVDDAAEKFTGEPLTEAQGLANDYFQRAEIQRGLQGLQDDDWVIVADVDEIPDPKTLFDYDPSQYPIGEFQQKFYYYYVNVETHNHDSADGGITPCTWVGPRVTTWKHLQHYFGNPNNLRFREPRKCWNPLWQRLTYRRRKSFLKKHSQKIIPGGWHFSFLLSPEQIKEKIESYCHRQYDQPSFKDLQHIQAKMQSGQDIFNRDQYHYERVEIDDSYPEYLLKNLDRYANYVA